MAKQTTLYRYLTGPDDAVFCHRVSEALSRGWELYGPPTLTYDVRNSASSAARPSSRTWTGPIRPI